MLGFDERLLLLEVLCVQLLLLGEFLDGLLAAAGRFRLRVSLLSLGDCSALLFRGHRAVGQEDLPVAQDQRDVGDPLSGILPEQLARFRIDGEDLVAGHQVAASPRSSA